MGSLQKAFRDLTDIEYRARDVIDRLALALQAALLVQHAPSFVADPFCVSRLASSGHHNYGTLPRGVDCTAIIERATPKVGRVLRRTINAFYDVQNCCDGLSAYNVELIGAA